MNENFATGLVLGGVAGFLISKLPFLIILILVGSAAITYQWGVEQIQNMFDSED